MLLAPWNIHIGKPHEGRKQHTLKRMPDGCLGLFICTSSLWVSAMSEPPL